MKLTHKTAGLGIAALAVLALGTAAIADNMGQMRMGDGMAGHGMMMDGPVLDLTAIDANKDGKVSKDELTAYRAARVAAVDGNADGKLSADELAAARQLMQADGLAVLAALQAEPFDPAMLGRALDVQADHLGGRLKFGSAMIRDYLLALPLEARLAFAGRLEQRMRRGRDGGKDGGKDGN